MTKQCLAATQAQQTSGSTSCDASPPSWYLVQSRPNQLERAQENLARQGYTTFLPRYTKKCVRRGRLVKHDAALFPNYLFIRLNRWSDNWYPLRSTRGVSRLVTFGADPLAIPDRLIDAIRERVKQHGVQPAFKPGETVELIDGPFRGLNAIFDAQRDEERVILLIDLLHRQLRVTTPIGNIRKSA